MPTLTELDSLPQSDQDAIATTLGNLLAGFKARDTTLLGDVYSADADWVNAFGTAKRGADEIIDYLTGLFADEHFNDGELAGPPEVSIRVVTPEVVLVSAHLVVLGQGLTDGSEIDRRDNRSLRALHRQTDGRWLIVSEMYNDANREVTYAH